MATMQKSDVDAVSQELVLGQLVQTYLQQEGILFPTVSNFFAPTGVDLLKIPKAGGFTVNDKAAGTAVTAQALTYSTDDLALDKHKVIQVNVEKFANIQSSVQLFNELALRVGKDMAKQLDADIIVKLLATSSASPDHRIAYAGSAIAAVDILEGLRLLKMQYVNTKECFLGISPGSEKAMLQIDNFVRADAYGNGGNIMNGEIGRIYGLKVIVHTGFADAGSVIWHPSHVAAAIQESVTYDTQKDLPNLAQLHSWDMIYGLKTQDSGKRGVLLGSAT